MASEGLAFAVRVQDDEYDRIGGDMNDEIKCPECGHSIMEHRNFDGCIAWVLNERGEYISCRCENKPREVALLQQIDDLQLNLRSANDTIEQLVTKYEARIEKLREELKHIYVADGGLFCSEVAEIALAADDELAQEAKDE